MARILIAEDDENVRAFVTRALISAGHEVTEADDGGIAAEICAEREGAFDLLLSGFADQRERAHGLEALIYDVVPKPFSLQVLLDKVTDALSGKPIELPSLTRLAG